MERIFAHLSRKTDRNKSVIGQGVIGLFSALRNITWCICARTRHRFRSGNGFSITIPLTLLAFYAERA
ncbi:hypothetical protein [Pantoea vagans]|uniref:hypothetical protein n=1 Tax=Pantoea vagans TaxID=470934 RepID=UPI000FFE86B9|nr:hypothetical protein [Pantoea vagans]